MNGPRSWLRSLMNQVNDLPDPGERGGRVMMWLGHNLMPIMFAWAAFVVPDDLLGNPGGWMHWAGAAVSVMYLAVFWSEIRWHRKRLCEKCAGKTPLDPEASVRRWKPALRAVHRSTPIVMSGIILSLALSFVGHEFWADLTAALLAVGVLGLWLSMHVHDRLQPWCPWCNWGKGGDEEVSPEVPDPALSK